MGRRIDRSRIKRITMDVLITVLGTAIVALALSTFTIPNDIAPGGVTGLATALAHVTSIRVSAWSLILNVPLLVLAWHMLGLRSLAMTLLSTLLLSLFIELSSLMTPYTNNPLLAAAFGGALTGLGVGILFLRGISTGGTDLMALLLKKLLPNIPNGTLLMLIDGAVVAIAVFIFREIEVALYSTVAILISSKVIDALAEGVDYAKVVYTITEKGEDVAKILNTNTERGTTVLPAMGGYTGDKKQMIVTVTRRNVLAQTLKLIKMADPDAFTFVMDSTEVHGEGFKREYR